MIKTIDPTVKPYTFTDFAKDTDKPFIYSTWIQSYAISQTARMCKSEGEYKKLQSLVIDAILSQPSTQVYVSRLKDEPDSILSYAVIDCVQKCLHYTYTKLNYRNCALAQNLCLGKGLEYYSHHRAPNAEGAASVRFAYEHMVPKWATHLRYHPYLLLEVVKSHGSRIGHTHAQNNGTQNPTETKGYQGKST